MIDLKRAYDGEDFAKVLLFYGVIDTVTASDFNIVCPFHEDVNPSMRITLNNGKFFCFGCRASGDVFDFVSNVHPELSDLQVAILIAKIKASKEVKDIALSYKRRRKRSRKNDYYAAHDYFYGLNKVDWSGELTEEQEDILGYMEGRGFTRDSLNLVDCRETYNVAYPSIFPILDNERFCGWVCRTPHKSVAQYMKYKYNGGFYKRATLCGSYEKNSIVFLCEGFFDYLSLRTVGGAENVAALLGWHISDEQTKKLKDAGVVIVISALDSDECGEKGTEYLKKFFNVVRFRFPEGVKDPGEMAEKKIDVKSEVRRSIREARRIVQSGDTDRG